MNKIKYAAFVLLTAISLCSCSSEEKVNSNTRDYLAMDTVFSLRTGDVVINGTADSNKSSIERVFDECETLTGEIERSLSVSMDGAEANSFNKDIDVMLDADPLLCDVLNTAIQISELTNGAYDPAIGTLTSLWNVKGGGPVPSEDSVKSALNASGIHHITLKGNEISKSNPNVKLDLGGIGKGYAAQAIAEKLHDSGVSYGIVSAGRNVGVFGEKPDSSPFKIGIADPGDANGVIGYIYTESGFISVSGDYEQFFEENGKKYHHIIDPKTGYPSDSGITSVAVLSQNGAASDALSTALFVIGYDKSIELYNSDKFPFEAVFVMTDGSVKWTAGLSDGRFVLSETYGSDTAADANTK